jgi:hypothetical protein
MQRYDVLLVSRDDNKFDDSLDARRQIDLAVSYSAHFDMFSISLGRVNSYCGHIFSDRNRLSDVIWHFGLCLTVDSRAKHCQLANDLIR